jgi:phytoene dehydrogenase-like protein
MRVGAVAVAFVLCVIFVFIGPPLLRAAAAAEQPISYALTAWTTEKGLPPGDVLVMTQDLDGYLWIGTTSGLVRFAGLHQDDPGWWLRHAPAAVRRVWPLLREGRATVGEVLGGLFGAHEAVKLALAANLSYYHDDPDRMSFLSYAIPQASYLTGGGHYVREGSAALTNRLVALIHEAGGIVEAGREVDTLLVSLAGVSGVRHRTRAGDDVAFEDASVVFGNAAPHRLAEMLPKTVREAFFAPYAHRPLSISLWTVSIGLRRPASEFGVRHYSTFMVPAWMKALSGLRETAAVMAEPDGQRLPAHAFVDYHHIDSGLNETGPYLGSFCGVDRLDNWVGLSTKEKSERKERWMDRLIADLDREFPGIAGAVVHREMATAETLAHYLNTPGGAVYGFAPEGSLADVFGFTPRTRIDGLWLASAYTFAGGFTGAMLGGAEAARQAIKAAVDQFNPSCGAARCGIFIPLFKSGGTTMFDQYLTSPTRYPRDDNSVLNQPVRQRQTCRHWNGSCSP